MKTDTKVKDINKEHVTNIILGFLWKKNVN